MTEERIADKLPYPSKYAGIFGSKMHFIEVGEGDPILFLHGIPTSCYLWRNIIPHLAPLGRCIAVDLMGFGKSDKPDIDYSIQTHIKYINEFIETLKLKNITFIMHGWGSVMGLDYAMSHENNCKGLVAYEAFICPVKCHDMSLPFQEQLLALQAHENEEMTAAEFIDKMMPQNAIRELSPEEMENYREPFLHSGNKPITQYLHELPKGDETNVADKIIVNYSNKLTQSSLPKLLMYSVPGLITTIATVMWAKEHLSNLEIVDVGEELHLAQESYPALIGETISVWLQGVEAVRV